MAILVLAIEIDDPQKESALEKAIQLCYLLDISCTPIGDEDRNGTQVFSFVGGGLELHALCTYRVTKSVDAVEQVFNLFSMIEF